METNIKIANFGFNAVISKNEHYFISYSRDDADRIAPIAQAIYDKACKTFGRPIPFWYDRSGLKFGTEWEEQIIQSLKSCKAVIMFLTNDLFQKEDTYMLTEYELATKDFKKTVYCIWLDPPDSSSINDRLRGWRIKLHRLQGLECIPCETTDSIANRVIAMISGSFVPKPISNNRESFWKKYKNILIPTLIIAAVIAFLTFSVIVPAIKNSPTGGTAPINPNSSNTSPPASNYFQDDTSTYSNDDKNNSITVSVSRVGQTVTFGNYEQDNITSNGEEPLEWIVLEMRNNTALIITKYGIDNPPFNNSKTDTTWANSNLRQWMNNKFYNKAFSSQEKEAILEANVSSENSLKWGTKGGSSTQDKIFALSESETNKYFTSNSDRQTLATSYAESNGATVSTDFFINGQGTTWWWLRNPGSHANEASYISGKGSIAVYGAEVNSSHVCARPAMWVAIN